MNTLPTFKEQLVLYELDNNGEAISVYYFDSEKCRDEYYNEDRYGVPHARGTSPDAIDGTVCDRCGTPLKGD